MERKRGGGSGSDSNKKKISFRLRLALSICYVDRESVTVCKEGTGRTAALLAVRRPRPRETSASANHSGFGSKVDSKPKFLSYAPRSVVWTSPQLLNPMAVPIDCHKWCRMGVEWANLRILRQNGAKKQLHLTGLVQPNQNQFLISEIGC